MKIQIFIRSADWLNTAGTRIRYRRLQQEMSRLGSVLAIDPMSAIREGLKLNADVYLFSKCHDAGALMVGDMLREAGALVGFDLFDDYISGCGSLTGSHRAFQRALRGRVDFLLCSTDRMADVVRSFDPTVPIHVLNDPFETYVADALPRMLDAKLEVVRTTRQLEMLWFGVGNNPIYAVGINDLVGFWGALKPFKTAGFTLRLKVLTNADAINAEGLRRLRNLPIHTEIEEWSSEREKAALNQAFLAFLPVGFQNFSIAKSLNRAVTALTHGAQVLNAGHSLYHPLNPFVYRDAKQLLDDLAAGSLQVRRATLQSLRQRLVELADPRQEARRFLQFLCAIPIGTHVPVEQRVLRAIIHGAASTPAIHSICQTLGWLSLGSPLSRQTLAFHAQIGFFDGSDTPELRLSRSALNRLTDDWNRLVVPLGKSATGELTHRLAIDTAEGWQYLALMTKDALETRAGRMVHAERIMAATESIYQQVFGALKIMHADLEMPFPATDIRVDA